MKVKSSIKKMCDNCQVVQRRGYLRIVCKESTHKQRQG